MHFFENRKLVNNFPLFFVVAVLVNHCTY